MAVQHPEPTCHFAASDKIDMTGHLIRITGEASQTVCTDLGKDGLVGWALFHGTADLIKVLCACQLIVAMRVQETKITVQLAPVIPG